MSKKVVIIVAVSFLIVMGLMGAGFYVVLNKVASIDGEQKVESPAVTEAGEKPPMIGPIFSLDTFIVNLADKDGKRYLRLTADLELSGATVSEEITTRLPQVRDSILMILPTKKLEELQSVEGKTALREEIITKLNGFLTKGQITNLYFTEFVFQ